MQHAKASDNPNEGNDYVIEGANLNDSEHFEISFADLGITSTVKMLETTGLDVNVYNDEVIGTVTNIQSGETASYEWEDAVEGINGWYAEVTDENGGLSRTNVYYVNVNRDLEAPVLTVPEDTTIQTGDAFDVMEGVTATDNVDGVVTGSVIVTGKVNTSVAGTYELVYEVTDAAGNTQSVTRVVVVKEAGGIDTDVTNPDEDGNGTTGSNSNVKDPAADTNTESNAGVATGDTTNIMLLGLMTILSAIVLFIFAPIRSLNKRRDRD